MDNFEKVEKLRERANVSYEEAKDALERCGWDVLDAMVLLEKQGKTSGPAKTSYSTDYDQQEGYAPVEKTVYNEEKEKGRARRSFKSLVRDFIRICRDNAFVVTRKEREVFRVPVSILVLVVLLAWKLVLPAMIIGLFLGFKYSFEGKDDLEKANELMNSAENVANYVKKEFAGKEEDKEDEQ